jgi:hypothetical protein
MRRLLILGGVGILSAAVWAVTCSARAQGLASKRDTSVQGGFECRIVHVQRHAGRFMHTFFATETEMVPYLFIGEPGQGAAAPGMFTGVAVVGGTEQMTADHLAGHPSHPPAHAAVVVGQAESLITQPAASDAFDSDRTGAATTQPDPTANPVSQRPPGALGPGRPVSGWSGPGLPGPGRAPDSGW